MIVFDHALLKHLAIHRVGNPSREEPLFLSEGAVPLSETYTEQLIQFLRKGFSGTEEIQRFTHASHLDMNEMYAFSKLLFEEKQDLLGLSKHIANHLYEQSEHPKIKSGELMVMHLEELVLQDELVQALVLVKCEVKTPFLQFIEEQGTLSVHLDSGIQMNRIDKGCIICDSEKENGFRVFTIDSNRDESRFWTDHFLQLEMEDPGYMHTEQTMDLVHRFASEVMGPERMPERLEMIDKSLKYMEQNDSFEAETFVEEVIQTPAYVEQFKQMQQEFVSDAGLEDLGDFKISHQQVRKAKRKFKNLIKLDSGIDIQLNFDHENQQEFIERGFDEQKGMHFYKVFFHSEAE